MIEKGDPFAASARKALIGSRGNARVFSKFFKSDTLVARSQMRQSI